MSSHLFLVFSSKADALLAEDKINQNMGFPLMSRNAASGQENCEAQITERWNGLKKAHGLELYYLAKPPLEEHLDGLEKYTIQEFNPEWREPPLDF